MDWFERLTGFKEGPYDWTRNQMTVHGEVLRSAANGQSFQIGRFEMVSLAELRALSAALPQPERRSRMSVIVGDVRRMHAMPGNANALFQVASQFNALEMVGPHVSPEGGVTRYEFDRTQGPACAIAAGAATIYRNYFVPNGDQTGQTTARQHDGLSDLGCVLARTLGTSVADLWTMQNGYALATLSGLERIAEHINDLTPEQVDELAGHIRFGLHSDIEVTDSPTQPKPIVSQIFCSALPVAYGRHPVEAWRLFGQLVLDAAYEATLLAARLNKLRGKSNVVYLTLLGGGAFGNPTGWIFKGIKLAMAKASHLGLDVRVVSYGPPSHELQSLVRQINPFPIGNDGSDCTHSDNWLS